MSGLENLRLRMNYHGGARQKSRMNEDKLVALKKALCLSGGNRSFSGWT